MAVGRHRHWLSLFVFAVLVLAACNKPAQPAGAGGATGSAPGGASVAGLPADALQIAKERGLTPADVAGALKTYLPSGKLDEYVMFASGGHGGQVMAIGLPSMRLLKVIGVFAPEPWQGWGYNDETREILAGGRVNGKDITLGDTHHPNLSETNGEYDGQHLFINDKINGRLAVIDLRDWETKQIIKNPIFNNDHGGSFVTPNTDYIVEGAQYGLPLGGAQADISQYKEKYRGVVTFWKFNREKGRVDTANSWSIELPPYWQDLCDAGKGPSDGWAFCNSINTELATGKVGPNDVNFEAGTTQRDRDYLHVFNWKKAEELVKAGKTETINGMKVIRLETAAKEGVLYFIPEPKSPHGADVTPKGTHIVVGGKLDPHVSVYSFKKIQDAIAKGGFDRDSYGVPVIKFEDALEAQVELGLGPLHTVFDDQGYAYTSLFLDTAVARWSLGTERPQDGWKLISKLPVQYNIGHLTAVEGDTAKPGGKFLVALNKWSIDRFLPTGPLHPQNLQLVDISQPGDKMQVLYDMPIGIGEPHYAQIIKASRLKTWTTYPEVGWNPSTQSKEPNAAMPGKERVERRGNTVEIWMTAVRSHFTPEHIEIKKGDHVIWHITNVERARDATHGFALPGYNINLSLEPGESATFTFDADKDGTYSFYCTEFCSALHLEMMGYMQIK